MEKSMTTPDYYPLTLNALTSACNQKSNRNPVVSMTEDEVFEVLSELRRKDLSEAVYAEGTRSERYRHLFNERFGLSRRQNAVLCELFLRGPQTPGELNSRAGRMAKYGSAAAIVEVLESLSQEPPGTPSAGTAATDDGSAPASSAAAGPFVKKLPRRPGQKDSRWTHLLGIETEDVTTAGDASSDARPTPTAATHDQAVSSAGAALLKKTDDQRVINLENEVAGLKRELRILNERLDGLRRDLDEIRTSR